jgi:lipid-binding SYLF domain-containing protein
MRRFVIAASLATLAAPPLFAALNSAQTRRIEDAGTVLTEIHKVPDKDVPQDLWDKASCVMVIPGLKKAAFVIGGEYGKGLMSCRRDGAWSAPLFMRLEKGSWGLQIGAQSIDLVLLVMNQGGIEKLLGNKVSLGADMSVAAGPVGLDARAAPDVQV